MDPIPLMGTSELRIRFGGVSSQRVDAIVRKPHFPRPVAVLAMGRVWHRDEVEAWVREHREEVAEPAEGEG